MTESDRDLEETKTHPIPPQGWEGDGEREGKEPVALQWSSLPISVRYVGAGGGGSESHSSGRPSPSLSESPGGVQQPKLSRSSLGFPCLGHREDPSFLFLSSINCHFEQRGSGCHPGTETPRQRPQLFPATHTDRPRWRGGGRGREASWAVTTSSMCCWEVVVCPAPGRRRLRSPVLPGGPRLMCSLCNKTVLVSTEFFRVL